MVYGYDYGEEVIAVYPEKDVACLFLAVLEEPYMLLDLLVLEILDGTYVTTEVLHAKMVSLTISVLVYGSCVEQSSNLVIEHVYADER